MDDGTCQASATPRTDLIMRGFEEVSPWPSTSSKCFQQLPLAGPVVVSIAVGDHNTTKISQTTKVACTYQDKCGGTIENDHELLLVGYDYNYYILKNSSIATRKKVYSL